MSDLQLLAEWIVEQTSDAMIYVDCSGTIVRWNRASAELFAFEKKEALGQSLDLIIPERLRAAHWAGFNAAIERGSTQLNGRPTLTRATHRSGTKLYVEMTFALVKSPAGVVLGSVAIARDVTTRVEAERAKRSATADSTNGPAT